MEMPHVSQYRAGELFACPHLGQYRTCPVGST
jgi:hypothetical protein